MNTTDENKGDNQLPFFYIKDYHLLIIAVALIALITYVIVTYHR